MYCCYNDVANAANGDDFAVDYFDYVYVAAAVAAVVSAVDNSVHDKDDDSDDMYCWKPLFLLLLSRLLQQHLMMIFVNFVKAYARDLVIPFLPSYVNNNFISFFLLDICVF